MDGPETPSTIEDLLWAAVPQAFDPNCSVIQGIEDLSRLCSSIFGERDFAIVGIAPRAETNEPVLAAADARAVVGPAARIYLFADGDLLPTLNKMLGPRLKIDLDSARVWWPCAGVHSDPADHPLVYALAGERRRDTLAEFAREVDLSRPSVRREIRLIDDNRALLERELARMEERNRRLSERLRDTQIESHQRLSRAQAAEARLGDAPEAAGGV
jgi:hypothetical protein